MANLSIREAVKHYQVSRPTLTKALKSGKVSGTQDGQGKWSIDPSELARVYQPRTGASDATEQPLTGQPAVNLVTSDPAEIEVLRAQLAEVELRAVKAETRADAAELLAKERAERIEDLRRMLPPPEAPQKRRWWRRG